MNLEQLIAELDRLGVSSRVRPTIPARPSNVLEQFQNYGVTETKGQIGIEIEVEGARLPPAPVGWKGEHDGSLRGPSMEYVLKKPCNPDKVPLYLSRLMDKFLESGTVLNHSTRSGVHIHINVQDMTMTQLGTYIVLYLIFEETILEFCGEDRVGNLFALRAVDADYLVSKLAEAFRNERYVFRDDLRYAALNPTSLQRYGSLEFRAMGSMKDFDDVNCWAQSLYHLKLKAMEFDHPTDVIEMFSEQGLIGVFDEVFGNLGLEFNYDLMLKGIRMAQQIAYRVPAEVQGDPMTAAEYLRRMLDNFVGYGNNDVALIEDAKRYAEEGKLGWVIDLITQLKEGWVQGDRLAYMRHHFKGAM